MLQQIAEVFLSFTIYEDSSLAKQLFRVSVIGGIVSTGDLWPAALAADHRRRTHPAPELFDSIGNPFGTAFEEAHSQFRKAGGETRSHGIGEAPDDGNRSRDEERLFIDKKIRQLGSGPPQMDADREIQVGRLFVNGKEGRVGQCLVPDHPHGKNPCGPKLLNATHLFDRCLRVSERDQRHPADSPFGLRAGPPHVAVVRVEQGAFELYILSKRSQEHGGENHLDVDLEAIQIPKACLNVLKGLRFKLDGCLLGPFIFGDEEGRSSLTPHGRIGSTLDDPATGEIRAFCVGGKIDEERPPRIKFLAELAKHDFGLNNMPIRIDYTHRFFPPFFYSAIYQRVPSRLCLLPATLLRFPQHNSPSTGRQAYNR